MIHQNSLNTGVTWRATAVDGSNEIYNLIATAFAYDTLGIKKFGCFDATGSSPDDIDERVYNPSGQLVYYTPITLGEISGVNDYDDQISYEVFPNPSSDVININLAFDKQVDYALVLLYDATGKMVQGRKYSNVTDRNVRYNVADFAPGVYTVKIQTPEGYNAKTFVVQH